MSYYVVVYGTLKKGHGNHNYLMKEERYIGQVLFKGRLFTNGAFPAWINGKDWIIGELYEVSDITMPYIDSLEGNGYLYQREEIIVNHEGDFYKAWCYKWMDQKNLSGWKRILPNKFGRVYF